MIEPLACCIRGLRNTGTGFNDTVLIIGAGPLGLMHLQLSLIAVSLCIFILFPQIIEAPVALVFGT